jgi:hypothetical protein
VKIKTKIKPYNNRGYIVRISEPALIQMVLNGLEAYSIGEIKSNRQHRKLETIGLLWGHEHSLEEQILYCIEMVSIETSAERKQSSVSSEDDSLNLKHDIITSFWPHLDFIGDFHTHPYKDCKDVINDKGYFFSDYDYKSINKFSDFWINYNYRVGIVLTIATMERKGSRKHDWVNNSTIEFTLGNCRMWLKTYVTYLENEKLLISEHNDEKISLDCPSLVGLFGEHTPMKKIS